MASITECLTQKDKESFILPIIIDCLKDEEDDERRFAGVILIDELAQALG